MEEYSTAVQWMISRHLTLPLSLVRNYIAEALDAILSGRKITVSATRPYGCGIKLEK